MNFVCNIVFCVLAAVVLAVDCLPVSNITSNETLQFDSIDAFENQFRFPLNCDIKKQGDCDMIVTWQKSKLLTMDFHMIAKLQRNEWMGFTWFKTQPSLVNADFMILSVVEPDQKAGLDKNSSSAAEPIASVTRGSMDALGVVRPDAVPMVSNINAKYDAKTGMVEAKFSRPLVMKNGLAFVADLNLCPSWIFMPTPGTVEPSTIPLLTKYNIEFDKGVILYAINFKC